MAIQKGLYMVRITFLALLLGTCWSGAALAQQSNIDDALFLESLSSEEEILDFIANGSKNISPLGDSLLGEPGDNCDLKSVEVDEQSRKKKKLVCEATSDPCGPGRVCAFKPFYIPYLNVPIWYCGCVDARSDRRER